MSYQGPWGPTGPQGPTGMTGRRGRQGDGFGPAGPSLYSGGRISSTAISESTLSPITVSAAGSGTYYSLNNASGIGNCTLNLPTKPPQGTFWVFYNANPTYKLQLTLANGTAVYNGNSAATFVEIANRNGLILAYNSISESYIVF